MKLQSGRKIHLSEHRLPLLTTQQTHVHNFWTNHICDVKYSHHTHTHAHVTRNRLNVILTATRTQFCPWLYVRGFPLGHVLTPSLSILCEELKLIIQPEQLHTLGHSSEDVLTLGLILGNCFEFFLSKLFLFLKSCRFSSENFNNITEYQSLCYNRHHRPRQKKIMIKKLYLVYIYIY